MADVKSYRQAVVDEDPDVPPLAFLTRIVVMPLGNLLGVILISLPFWPFAWFEELGRTRGLLAVAGGALLSLPIDILFRRRRRDQPARTRWFSPYEGGTVVIFPSWIVGTVVAGLIVWGLVTHPGR